MAGELSIPGLEPTALAPASKYSSEETFALIVKSGDYLPRCQLFGSNTNACKEGKIPIAHFGIVPNKETIIDIGERFDCAVLGWRPRAIRINGDSIDNYYDPKDKEFIKVQEESDVKDSGCMFGPEFLLWIPAEKQFVLMHFNNKTARRVAPEMLGKVGKAATLKSKLIKTDKYTWHGPEILACTTPIAPLPTAEEVMAQVEKFNNPVASTTETIDPKDAAAARER